MLDVGRGQLTGHDGVEGMHMFDAGRHLVAIASSARVGDLSMTRTLRSLRARLNAASDPYPTR
jgi:hypothetical protein